MRNPILFVLIATGAVPGSATAADWITAPSYFTHDRQTGQRVTQYTPIGPVYVFRHPNYMQSGYRHTRSTIEAGGSVDNLHLVEEWGRPVRPYDEWRFPFRPYSVPYQMWGPQLGGYGGFGGYGGGGFGGGFGGGGGFGAGGAGPFNPYGQGPQQTQDGHYPTYDSRDRAPYFYPYRGRYNSANGFGGSDGSTGVGRP